MGGRTTLLKAIEIVEYGNDDYISQIDNGVETINHVFNIIRVEKGQSLPPIEIQRRIIKQLEEDESAASEKISAMYGTIQDLKAENSLLKRNPTVEQFNIERERRVKAECALDDVRNFIINNPSGVNPEAVKVKSICEALHCSIPNKDSFNIAKWSDLDKKDCAKSLQDLMQTISDLLSVMKTAQENKNGKSQNVC